MIFGRNRKEVIAISIETAVQNNAFAVLLLKLSLEKPAGDLAVCKLKIASTKKFSS